MGACQLTGAPVAPLPHRCDILETKVARYHPPRHLTPPPHPPPYWTPLRGLQVKIRVYEPDSKQIREVTIVQDLLP